VLSAANGRIPHRGDAHRLWITDYPTVLPGLRLANRGEAERKTSKGRAHWILRSIGD
jgi:hypothetical protein